MKKLTSILAITIIPIPIFFACGPSKAEIEEAAIREAAYKKVMEEKAKEEHDSVETSIKAEIASEMDSLKRKEQSNPTSK